jgi:hypothetical protein
MTPATSGSSRTITVAFAGAPLEDKCWELDALDPNTLRDCVRKHIEENIRDREACERCKVTEQAEASSLRAVMNSWNPGKPHGWGLV